MESRESSSPLVTRAIAAALLGRDAPGYDLAAWQKLALRWLGALPASVGEYLIPRMQTPGAVPAERVRKLALEDLLAARLDDYAPLPGRFQAITAGAALGGPTTHLSLALGGPFLPQAFVISMQGGSKSADPQEYFLRGFDVAQTLAQRYPEILTIQHFDPVHDGWLTRQLNHLRIKLLDLPQIYKQFLRERLEPGGSVVYLDGGARWLRYRVGERSIFQVGGWGDVSTREFLDGSERLRAFARQEGISRSGWTLPGYPLEEGPESEWGSEPGLGDALESFCHAEGYQYVPIRLPHPHDFSLLAYMVHMRQLEKTGQAPSGVLVEMFSQFDAPSVSLAGLLPLWLIFNTADSLRYLKSMIPRFPASKPVFFSALSTFSRTPDIVPWQEWENALNKLTWTNVGARASRYPADTRALVDWRAPLRAWEKTQPVIHLEQLDALELKTLADNLYQTGEGIA